MASKVFLILTLALAATSSPLHPRQDAPTAAGPKPASPSPAAKGAPKGSSKGSGGAPKASGDAPASSSGFGALSGLLGGGGSMSYSDIKTKGTFSDFACKSAALIFARGTGEPGNMGYVVGPGLGAGLKKALNGDILLQGADYSTDFSSGGAKEMAAVAKKVIEKCPNTKIVLGGYSQGAMKVHEGLAQLGADASKIAAAVTFGDPYSTMGWGSGGVVGQVMGLAPAKGAAGGPGFNPANGAIFCSSGDFVCGITPNLGGGTTVPKAPKGSDAAPPAPPTAKNAGGQIGGFGGGHISYSSDGSIPKAITFIMSKIGTPAPAANRLEAASWLRDHPFGTYAS